eukprot:4762377-Prymnesium_polylepis.2
MGLGKTLQTISLLCWLRESMVCLAARHQRHRSVPERVKACQSVSKRARRPPPRATPWHGLTRFDTLWQSAPASGPRTSGPRTLGRTPRATWRRWRPVCAPAGLAAPVPRTCTQVDPAQLGPRV